MASVALSLNPNASLYNNPILVMFIEIAVADCKTICTQSTGKVTHRWLLLS